MLFRSTYKFQNGRGNFEGGDFLEACGIEGGFGFDRLLVTGQEDIVLDTVCFRYCVDCATKTGTVVPFTDASFLLRPNPANDGASFRYDLARPHPLRLVLRNTLGQPVLSESIGTVRAGSHWLDLSGVAAGVYYLVVTDGARRYTQRLVKQ